MRRFRLEAWAAAFLLPAACGRNPVPGDWQVDREDNARGALLAVEAARCTRSA